VGEYGGDGGGNNKEDEIDTAGDVMLAMSKVKDMAEDAGNSDENVWSHCLLESGSGQESRFIISAADDDIPI
jgi:hypothetical protein